VRSLSLLGFRLTLFGAVLFQAGLLQERFRQGSQQKIRPFLISQRMAEQSGNFYLID